MKITEIPPTPPEPKYNLELTREQLVALGILSYRHETQKTSSLISFYRSLPEDIRNESAKAGQPSKHLRREATDLEVDWDA